MCHPKVGVTFGSHVIFFCVAHAAVPEFAAGAMENWGLILYREVGLLYDPAASSARQKQRTAHLVSHELAHMVCISQL